MAFAATASAAKGGTDDDVDRGDDMGRVEGSGRKSTCADRKHITTLFFPNTTIQLFHLPPLKRTSASVTPDS